MIKEESWEDIEGYEGLYQVSSFGRIKSLEKRVTKGFGTRTVRERIRKTKSKTYTIVMLSDRGTNRTFRVNRLVAQAFIPNPGNKPCVNHKDGNKQNDHVSNLEWCTYPENTIHAIKNGLFMHARGEKASRSKLTESEVFEIRKMTGVTTIEMATIFNVSTKTIISIKSRKTWTHI